MSKAYLRTQGSRQGKALLRPFDPEGDNSDLTVEADDGDVVVAEFEDEHIMSLALQEEMFCNTAEMCYNPPIESWVVLDDGPLGDDVASLARSGGLHNPECPPHRGGRKPNKRRQKAFGPGS